MDNPLIDQLPNGGAVVAIIVVVVLFLRHLSEARKEYIAHLREVEDRQGKPKPKG